MKNDIKKASLFDEFLEKLKCSSFKLSETDMSVVEAYFTTEYGQMYFLPTMPDLHRVLDAVLTADLENCEIEKLFNDVHNAINDDSPLESGSMECAAD